jgi:hypothetical protein
MTTDLADLQLLTEEPIAEDRNRCIEAAESEARPTWTTVC